MIQSLESEQFFTEAEERGLRDLGLYGAGKDTREVFSALLLAPVLQLSLVNEATSPAQFEAIEQFMYSIEHNLELTTKEQLEAIGTEMGMLPFVKGVWSKENFEMARSILSTSLERLPEEEAHLVRNAISRACLEVAQAGSGFIHLGTIDHRERDMLHAIIPELKLESCSEGLNLLSKARQQ